MDIYYPDPNIKSNLKILSKICRELIDKEPNFYDENYPILSIEIPDSSSIGKVKLFNNKPEYYQILPHGWKKLDGSIVRLGSFKLDLMMELQLLSKNYKTTIHPSCNWTKRELDEVLNYLSYAVQLVRDKLI